jgi:hypothetical protein
MLAFPQLRRTRRNLQTRRVQLRLGIVQLRFSRGKLRVGNTLLRVQRRLADFECVEQTLIIRNLYRIPCAHSSGQRALQQQALGVNFALRRRKRRVGSGFWLS